MRERRCDGARPLPDSATLHPGYKRRDFPKNPKAGVAAGLPRPHVSMKLKTQPLVISGAGGGGTKR